MAKSKSTGWVLPTTPTKKEAKENRQKSLLRGQIVERERKLKQWKAHKVCMEEVRRFKKEKSTSSSRKLLTQGKSTLKENKEWRRLLSLGNNVAELIKDFDKLPERQQPSDVPGKRGPHKGGSGASCDLCKSYYATFPEENRQDVMNKVSRHRTHKPLWRHKRAPTPEGFWDNDPIPSLEENIASGIKTVVTQEGVMYIK